MEESLSHINSKVIGFFGCDTQEPLKPPLGFAAFGSDYPHVIFKSCTVVPFQVWQQLNCFWKGQIFVETICLKWWNLRKLQGKEFLFKWWKLKSFLLQGNPPLGSRYPIVDNISMYYNLVYHYVSSLCLITFAKKSTQQCCTKRFHYVSGSE